MPKIVNVSLATFGYPDEFNNLIEGYDMALRNQNGIGEQLNFLHFAKQCWKDKDASVNKNANVDDDNVMTYEQEIQLPQQKLNSLYRIWKQIKKSFDEDKAKEIIDDILTGRIYVNDSHGISSSKPYCWNFSCYDIMTKGLPYLEKTKVYRPKYFKAFIRQMEQFVTFASNQIKGACGIADFLIILSFYVKPMRDTLSTGKVNYASIEDIEREIYEELISFIHTINQPFRSGVESAFTNISIYDDTFLEKMASNYFSPEGDPVDIPTVKWLQDMFLKAMNEEMERNAFTFPVTTACIAQDDKKKILNPEFLTYIAEQNLKFSFINLFSGKSSVLSSCCRLNSDMESEFFNSLGAGATKIGSLGVCTVSLPHLAYMVKMDEVKLDDELERLVRNCFVVNYCKRAIIKETIASGKHPLYTHGFMDIAKQYCTCGVLGFYEMMDILEEDINDSKLGLHVINKINEVNEELQKAYQIPVNCEQIPGESAGVKLAQMDKFLGYNTEYELYSNQFIPLYAESDIMTRITLDAKYGEKFTGGKILHLSVGETPLHAETMALLYRNIIEAGCPYFALNYTLGMCEEGHVTANPQEACHCGAPITTKYERVVGFITKVNSWHTIRREKDFARRQRYNLGG